MFAPLVLSCWVCLFLLPSARSSEIDVHPHQRDFVEFPSDSGAAKIDSQKIRQVLHLDTLTGAALDENKYDSAYEYAKKELSLAREIRFKKGEANALELIGFVHRENTRYDSALSYHQRALGIREEIKDTADIASSLNDLGEIYLTTNYFQRSINAFKKSLELVTALQIPLYQATVLNNIAMNFAYLGYYDTALAYYHHSLNLQPQIGDKKLEAANLSGIGYIHLSKKRYQSALDYFKRGLKSFQEARDRLYQGVTYNNIALAHNGLKEYSRAMDAVDSALAIARETGSNIDEVISLARRGFIFSSSGKYTRAMEVLNDALVEFKRLGLPEGVATVSYRLMQAAKGLRNRNLAIFYGKQSVNIYQEQRRKFGELPKDIQQDYLKSKEPTYRELVDLLINQGRLLEAERVFRMLKEEEYFEFIRGSSETDSSLGIKINFTSEEQSWKNRSDALSDSIIFLEKAYHEIKGNNALTFADSARLSGLNNELTGVRSRMKKFLSLLVQSSQRWIGPTGRTRTTDINISDIAGVVKSSGGNIAALYTLVAENEYQVIVITRNLTTHASYKINRDTLGRKVQLFREILKHPEENPLPLARDLYTIIVAPVVSVIKNAHVTMLLWSLDGTLRYLPMGALHDDSIYMAERYSNVIFTPASVTRNVEKMTSRLRVLGLGVSKKFGDFPPLPYVPEELHEIILSDLSGHPKGLVPGTIKLDTQFTRDEMFASLKENFPLVHIATHFQFQPGDGTASFLLLGDGSHLTIDSLKTMRTPFAGVDLLTLSACNTAVGEEGAEGKEVESFAVNAQNQGAKAVLATLWSISDVSTPLLMKIFYKLLAQNPSIIKAEALRQAQCALLNDSVPGETIRRNRKPPFGHPYYWAPFVLTGNWK